MRCLLITLSYYQKCRDLEDAIVRADLLSDDDDDDD